ncbi:MAG: RNA polymerase sigma factor [Flavobacteriales bacterium]
MLDSVRSEQELIQLYLRGHEDALAVLINRYESKVFTYIKMMVQDQALAEDLFQDTFIKVILTLKGGTYNEEGKFLPWVMRIAHNLTIDHFRRNKRIPTIKNTEENDVFRTISESSLNVEEDMVKDQVLKDVKKLIKELPFEQQQVLVLRHYADMSFQEIADLTGVSINTALGRMRYALINLRKIIKEKEIYLSL